MDYKEKLKAIINSNKTPFVDIDTFLKYFPELKESEDEKIRKEIIDFVKSRGGFKGDWIAWLEKQGEAKKIIPEDAIVDSNDDGLVAETIRYKNEKQGEQKQELLTKEKALKNSPFVEQKPNCCDEQKPAEWSEEDEENFARVDYACLKTYGGDSYSSDWLRKFLGIHKKWKPSDKQMNALEHYMNTLVCNEHKEILFGLYADLKKLKG